MSKTTIRLLSAAVTYLLLTALVYVTCRYRLALDESLRTFYYDHDFTAQMLRSQAGLVDWLSLLVTQLFASPTAAALISGAVLTLIAWLTDTLVRHITGEDTPSPLSLVVPVSLCLVQPDIYCQYSYTVAIVLLLIALNIVMSMRRGRLCTAIALLLPLLLMHCAGSIAALYAVCITVIGVSAAPRRLSSWYFALTIPIVTLIAFLGIKGGIYSDFAGALTPAAYYTSWFKAPGLLYMPWIALVSVVLICCIIKWLDIKARRVWLIVECALTLGFSVYAYIGYRNPADELYAELLLYAEDQQWESISDRYLTAGLDEPRLRNLYNLSLAQRGQLSKVLFQQDCRGRETLLDTSSKLPDRYMLLGDIYYAMGHIALAQKFTFEANQGIGNLSPRMLRRLADLNLITGQYALAEKYINILSSTLLYSDWAAERRRLLYDDAAVAAHAELGPKQRCLFPDDRFSASRGIESDLTEILRQNPSHAVTMEYLGMLTLLSRNVPLFTAIAGEFYGTPAMSSPLPKHYQEALAVATLASGERLDIKYGLHPSTVQRCQDFWSKHQDQPGTFWLYLKKR